MSFMLEVHYTVPADPDRERALSERVRRFNGRLSYREDPPSESPVCRAVVLTFEFDRREDAQNAADLLYNLGEHVEGPVDYGP